MKHRRLSFLIRPFIPICFAALLFFSASPSTAVPGETASSMDIPVTKWLLLGPMPCPPPAFHEESRAASLIESLLKFDELDPAGLRPANNLGLTWSDGSATRWREAEAGGEGLDLVGEKDSPACAYLAAYIQVDRWTQLKLAVASPQAFRVFLDGEQTAIKTAVSRNAGSGNLSKSGEAAADLKLETGKHLLVVKTVFDPESGSAWSLHGRLSVKEPFLESLPRLTTSPRSLMTIGRLLDGPKPVRTSISPDGRLAALTVSRTLPPSDESESWLEIHDMENDRLLRSFRGLKSQANVQWAPTGRKLSYVSYGPEGGTLWIVDFDKGGAAPALENVRDLGYYLWAPDSSFIVYSITEEGPTDRPGVKRFVTMADRQPGWRNRSFLYMVDLKNGARRRLTAGELTSAADGITPDGKRLLISRSRIDLTRRPYNITELYELDLDDLSTRLLWEGPWLNGAQWVPDGKKLLLLGGPSLFGNLGVNDPSGGIPNEYDSQAYFFDPDAEKVEALTRNFDPSINQAVFSLSENCIYFIVTDREYIRLYRYSPGSKEFERMYCGADVIDSFSLAREKPMALYIGSGAASPPKAYAIDLKKKASRLIRDPGEADYADVEFGRVESWSFKNLSGTEIDGRVYYPPDFDPEKKYPCIVNYYGGTTPVSRSFGGRYPLNYYAAQGYVVYVLQPSGAVGYGQSFSSLHVNDWGQIVADEIIRGVTLFLEAHPFVDPDRVGCIGASFGGFMTMLLQTKTSMFASAIAHAGISAIASYWGEGFWGYLYSAVATANSFPWNRKDLYISQSPLFNADKISTPLLLLHGSVDTNVPPGESTQLYTALKLLGREVEYIQILDQNHHIMTYNKRILWTKTIIAWFDRWLKRQPQWWFELYPQILTETEKKSGDETSLIR